MSTARVPVHARNRHAVVDYFAFLLLFASVSIAVAVALGGIVLLLTPASEQTASASESSAVSSTRLISTDSVRQAGAQ